MSIVYGPVPSWRLGRSLGIDLLPGRGKTCTFDCVYCQLGRTTRPLAERGEFVSLDTLARELEAVRSVRADFVTFSGTGEPTLAANLGEAIGLARGALGLPVAVLTNSSLMTREDVRRDLAGADVVVAKLDAPDERLFQRVNRPLPGISVKEVIDAIRVFRDAYGGRLALQMMFVEANRRGARALAAIAGDLSPDEVQINTPLRPCPVAPLPPETLAAVGERFRGLRGVHTVYEASRPDVTPFDVEETLRRRPGHEQGRADASAEAHATRGKKADEAR
jgi:wyosine [tRNA(Phe)-imidazoG37] synthetase (radical SAM superfamily)